MIKVISIVNQQFFIVITIFILARIFILLLLELQGKCLIFSDACGHHFFVSAVAVDVDAYGKRWTVLL